MTDPQNPRAWAERYLALRVKVTQLDAESGNPTGEILCSEEDATWVSPDHDGGIAIVLGVQPDDRWLAALRVQRGPGAADKVKQLQNMGLLPSSADLKNNDESVWFFRTTKRIQGRVLGECIEWVSEGWVPVPPTQDPSPSLWNKGNSLETILGRQLSEAWVNELGGWEGQARIRSAVESKPTATVHHHDAAAPLPSKAAPEPEPWKWTGRVIDKLPAVEVGFDQKAVCDKVLAVLAGRSNVYQHALELVEVGWDPGFPLLRKPGRGLFICPLSKDNLREIISENVSFFQRNKEQEPERIYIPSFVAENLIKRRTFQHILPLSMVSSTPVLLPDGSIVERAGYHAASGVYYQPSLQFPSMPSRVTRDDAGAALAKLRELFVDFPFEGGNGDTGATDAIIACILSAIGRPIYSDISPIFLVDSNESGTGKTIISKVIGTILNGRPLSSTTWSTNGEEIRKRITGLAREGANAVLIDNVVGELGGGELESALTNRYWADRSLGANAITERELNTTWLANGNNVSITNDMRRRTVRIRLRAGTDPYKKEQNYRFEDIEQHALEERAQYILAALTILKGYIDAGRPKMKLLPWGGYKRWSDAIRAALVWAGGTDVANFCEGIARTNESNWIESLLLGISSMIRYSQGSCLTSAEMMTLITSDKNQHDRDAREGRQATLAFPHLWTALSEKTGSPYNALPSVKSFGKMLSEAHDRVRRLALDEKEEPADWAVREGKDINGIRTWWVGHPSAPVPARKKPEKMRVQKAKEDPADSPANPDDVPF